MQEQSEKKSVEKKVLLVFGTRMAPLVKAFENEFNINIEKCLIKY